MFSKSSICSRTTLRILYVFEKKLGFLMGKNRIFEKNSDFREKNRIFEKKNRDFVFPRMFHNFFFFLK